MGAPALYPGGFGVVLMMLLMTLVTPVEAVAGTVVAILLGVFIFIFGLLAFLGWYSRRS